jgi:hypothetical protein
MTMNHAPGRSPACEFANFTGAAPIGPHADVPHC